MIRGNSNLGSGTTLNFGKTLFITVTFNISYSIGYSDWFDNYEDEEMAHPALGILVMTEAMNNLKERYCQHDISDMTITAVDQYTDMEVDLANEEGRIPFDDECEHDDKPTFLELMEPISKRVN